MSIFKRYSQVDFHCEKKSQVDKQCCRRSKRCCHRSKYMFIPNVCVCVCLLCGWVVQDHPRAMQADTPTHTQVKKIVRPATTVVVGVCLCLVSLRPSCMRVLVCRTCRLSICLGLSRYACGASVCLPVYLCALWSRAKSSGRERTKADRETDRCCEYLLDRCCECLESYVCSGLVLLPASTSPLLLGTFLP